MTREKDIAPPNEPHGQPPEWDFRSQRKRNPLFFNVGGALCQEGADGKQRQLGYLGARKPLLSFLDWEEQIEMELILSAAPVLLDAAKKLIASNAFGENVHATTSGSWAVDCNAMQALVRAVKAAEGRGPNPITAWYPEPE